MKKLLPLIICLISCNFDNKLSLTLENIVGEPREDFSGNDILEIFAISADPNISCSSPELGKHLTADNLMLRERADLMNQKTLVMEKKLLAARYIFYTRISSLTESEILHQKCTDDIFVLPNENSWVRVEL